MKTTMIAIVLGLLIGIPTGLLVAHLIARPDLHHTRCCEDDPPAGCGYDTDGRPVVNYDYTYGCDVDAGARR